MTQKRMPPSTLITLALHFCVFGTSMRSALITASKPYMRIHLAVDVGASCRHVLVLRSRCTTTPGAARAAATKRPATPGPGLRRGSLSAAAPLPSAWMAHPDARFKAILAHPSYVFC